VLSIRSYLVRQNATELISIKNALLHGGAFAIYLLSVVVLYSATTLQVILNHGLHDTHLVYFALFFFYLTSFIAQCMLIVIFWDMGTAPV
jgi:hypothetical protein